ncbi:GNAT family N-acetyltransferase [uncultured Sulfitobacter sp.]|uniref:GNAT family N-acetyltransferase n=1 Tax=uncultured Sulfitobacter sp. TaxID=191468 RepID=UPI002620B529|nr:GNAT family N-acetyltransferase [uncultured Sulfitobacter sp.]
MSEIEIRPFTPDDRDWVVAAHADVYAREAGFDDSFGVLVGEIVDAFIAEHDPAVERGWIAWDGGVRLGSIFCVRVDAQTAKLRLFQLSAQARGRGLGRRLLDVCTEFARVQGYRDMVLSTHRSHEAACALYLRNGWREVDERPVHHYGQPLVELDMMLTL